MRKSFLRIFGFTLLLIIILYGVNSVFKIKEPYGIYAMENYYKQDKNSVDVLILGSSHAFENINTGTLWEKYGIASYVLGGSIQPLWNTYYYLKEALKTQTPKLIVLEGFATTLTDEYSDDGRIVLNTYGLKWSLDKIRSLLVSAPSDKWDEFILEYVQYHNRYAELTDSDFLPNQNNRLYDNWKGFGCNTLTCSFEYHDVSQITDSLPLYNKSEDYYRKTIELAQNHNIPIIVIISPYAGISATDQKKFNTAAQIAKEYDVPFKNFNLEVSEIGLNYATDAADDSHLNHYGNPKYSDYLGSYLSSNFALPDRRTDDNYSSWEKNAEYIQQIISNQKLKESGSFEDFCTKLNNPNYWIFASIDGDISNFNYINSNLPTPLKNINKSQNDVWLLQNNNVLWKPNINDNEKYIQTPAHDFLVRRDYENNINFVIIDNLSYAAVTDGLNITVYDTLTEKIIETIGIDQDGICIKNER